VTGERSSTDDPQAPTRRLRANAPAKVNLTLDILARRDDGFHELRSLVMGVGLFDTITCSLAPAGSFTIRCNDPQLATAENLAMRAAKALAAILPDNPNCPGLAIELMKRIPPGGGLGGGSSDAATVLRLFNQLLGKVVSQEALANVGAEIGSDVPVFFGLPCAIMTGRGEIVEPVELRWRGSVLLILPGLHIATAEVYAARLASDSAETGVGHEQAILRAENAAEISENLTNGLEPAVFRVSPALGELVESLKIDGHGDIRVSGSGSTLFGLYDDPKKAGHAAKTIAERFSNVKTSVVTAPVGMNPFVSEDE
jgi:4-diphosphocytidyl-2-C-methyl-D-erythritol kinase